MDKLLWGDKELYVSVYWEVEDTAIIKDLAVNSTVY